MPSKPRPDPIIPDHEVLRKIGGGAYGEVWLARGVTGALRAVKIVWREDFDDARGFEREFEGILKFEPISRDHPGLVNVLHVGRSPDGTSFYYYVMELGDDVRTGQDINPVEYEPRTLRADAKISGGVRMETSLCIDVGVRLAEALDHLHERGLAHRDVKPANVIFVNGKAKLADIGLVASRDQRTFVGTEGFVPPEGPGSAPADVYSLGKVLYEIATGKDRLDFPELPDELPPPEERKRWLDLNRIICDICDPYLSRRKVTSARDLAEALRHIQRGKRRRSTGLAAWITAFILTAFAVIGSWEALKDTEVAKWFMQEKPPEPTPQPEKLMGQVRVVSYPEGAEVFSQGVWLGVTPLDRLEPVGAEVEYTIRMAGFKEHKVNGKVPKSAVNEPMPLGDPLLNYTPPEFGEKWVNQGVTYQPVGKEHLGSIFVNEVAWNDFVSKTSRKNVVAETIAFSQNGKPDKIVLGLDGDAKAFCEWLRADAIKEGRLTEDHEMIPQFEEGFNDPALTENAKKLQLKPFHILVRMIPYGQLVVSSTPPGAVVTLNEKGIYTSGNDPLLLPKIKPGEVVLQFLLDGYKPVKWVGELKPGETLQINQVLEENQGLIFGKPWKNKLGMQFVPLGQDKEMMVSIWETRVSDYDEYRKSEQYKKDSKKPGTHLMRTPNFNQGKDHPVVYVTRENAEKFCEWLTTMDVKEQRITVGTKYRLPTDEEWSRMVGVAEVSNRSPGWRDARKAQVYPWGSMWPPPAKWANLADIASAKAPGVSQDRTIPGYNDGFEYTAPVGSFEPTMVGEYKVYDLCGNVHEWVSDNYSSVAPLPGHTPYGVLRGGGWNSFQPESLYPGARNAVPANLSDNIYGFRVVLAKETPKTDNPNDTQPP